MRWPNGNLRPVFIVCEFDWRECPSAIVNYIWSEIVTDVVDCLTIESVIWRLIAMLFVCTLLVHTICKKTRWMNETTVNRKNLNIVGCKVQDLELKVNILTYKMQYGTWPLARQSRRNVVDDGLENVKLTLTESSHRNDWLRHMLLSPTENTKCLPYAKIGPRSVRCLTKLINLETKYMSSRFHPRDASPSSNKLKTSTSSSLKSIEYEKIIKNKKFPSIPKNEKSINKSESLKIDLKQSESRKSWKLFGNDNRSETRLKNHREQRSKILFERLDENNSKNSNDSNISKNCESSSKEFHGNRDEQGDDSMEIVDRREERKTRQQNCLEIRSNELSEISKKFDSDKTSAQERVNCSQETLQLVTQKLENLHNVLRNYGNEDCENCENPKETTTKKQLAKSILHDLKMLGDPPIETESDGKTVETIARTIDTNTDASRDVKDDVDSPSDFELSQTTQNSSSDDNPENSSKITKKKFDDSTELKNAFLDARTSEETTDNDPEDRTIVEDDDEKLTKFYQHFISTKMSKLDEKKLFEGTMDEESMEIVSSKTEDDLSELVMTSGVEESSKTSDIDETIEKLRTNELKNLKNDYSTEKKIHNEPEKCLNLSETQMNDVQTDSDDNWPKMKNYFQSKILEIISEEQSASSSTEKTQKPSPKIFTPSTTKPQRENFPEIEKSSSKLTKENSETSKNNLVTESSEYFSLSNQDDEKSLQNFVDPEKKNITSSSSCCSCSTSSSHDSHENRTIQTNEMFENTNDKNLQKNINDLVNQSVKNIRDYIQVFSMMQQDAILKTKKAIIDENSREELKNCSSEEIIMHQDAILETKKSMIDENSTEDLKKLKNCSSDDSIMHFVNTVAMMDSMSEELPRELPEPALNSLVDLDDELTDEDVTSTDNSNEKTNFRLKRRPGFISLTENNFETELTNFKTSSCEKLTENNSETELTDFKISADEKLTENNFETELTDLKISADGKSTENNSETKFTDFKISADEKLTENNSETELQNSKMFSCEKLPNNNFSPEFEDSKMSFCEIHESRSTFESARSNDDYFVADDSDNVSSEPSCKQLVMDYSLESDDDFTNEQSTKTFDLMEFDEIVEFDRDPKDDDKKTVDSPLTGRTVVRANDSLVSDLDSDFTNFQTNCNDEYSITKKSTNFVNDEKKSNKIVKNFELTSKDDGDRLKSKKSFEDDELSNDDEFENFGEKFVDYSMENVSECNTFVVDESSSEKIPYTSKKQEYDNNDLEIKDSAVSVNREESENFLRNKIKDEVKSEKNEISENCKIVEKNCFQYDNDSMTASNSTSTDTSGTYMDAESRESTNFREKNFKSDEKIVNSKIRDDEEIFCKSARGSSSTPLRQRVPWTAAPRRGSSLNNSTVDTTNTEIVKSKIENLQLSRSNTSRSRSTRSKSFNVDRTLGKNDSSRNFDSAQSTSSTRTEKNEKIDTKQRRSRSFVTPRKITNSPRNYSQTKTSEILESKQTPRDSKFTEKNSENLQKLKNTKIKEDKKKLQRLDSSKMCKKSETKIVSSSRSSLGDKTCSKSCIPILRSRLRAKSPMRGPLTISTNSWRSENHRSSPKSLLKNSQTRENIAKIAKHDSTVDVTSSKLKIVNDDEKMLKKSIKKMPDGRTVIYVNIVTDRDDIATRVVDPKKFLEYLNDRELKIRSVHDDRSKIFESTSNTSKDTKILNVDDRESPRILTVVSSATNDEISNIRLDDRSENSALTSSWSLRVEKREIEVSAKPSVMDTSTSISDLPEITTRTRENLEKIEIFEIPKELTKNEYIELLGALNRDPNLRRIREMRKLCDKIGLGFRE